MAQYPSAELIKKYFTVSDDYENLDDDLNSYYFTSEFSNNLGDLSNAISIICYNSEIKNRGDLCALTLNPLDIKELTKEIYELSPVTTFPKPRSLCCNTELVVDKIRFASEYDFPFLDDKNVILEECFDFKNDASNYLKAYYLKQTLYTPDEKKEDIIFRKLDDLDKYIYFCSNIQKSSYMCFSKLLKLNDSFNTFVVNGLSDDNMVNNYDDFVYESLKYLVNDENPFLDIDRMNVYSYNESLDEGDRGVRR